MWPTKMAMNLSINHPCKNYFEGIMANTQQLLDNLKSIQSKSEDNESTPRMNFNAPTRPPVSNQYGEDENGNPIYIDRIYGNLNGNIRLVQKDGSEYRGKINKRSIMVKDTNGDRFRSYVYETADGRWFNKGGMPIEEPKRIVKETEQQPEQESEQPGNQNENTTY